MNDKKYCVITFLFNGYDLLREPIFVNDDIDYYCLTDDKSLTSKVWKCIYINDFDTDNLSGVQKTYMAKYSFYKFLHKEYEWYMTIDASLEINCDLMPIFKKLENEGFDIGLSMHPVRSIWKDEYLCWIYARNLNKKYYSIFDDYAKKCGFDSNSQTGLIECTIKIYKNTLDVISFIKELYNVLLETNNFEDKNDQCYFTCVFSKYDNVLKSLFFYRQLYTKSKYFKSYYHKTNNAWQTDRTISNNTNILFNKKRELYEFK